MQESEVGGSEMTNVLIMGNSPGRSASSQRDSILESGMRNTAAPILLVALANLILALLEGND
jgi:hypothetical protein